MALVYDAPPRYSIRPEALAFEDDAFRVEIPAARGEAYFLETKRALEDSGWGLAQGVVARGSSAILGDPSTSESQRFYFVRQRLR